MGGLHGLSPPCWACRPQPLSEGDLRAQLEKNKIKPHPKCWRASLRWHCQLLSPSVTIPEVFVTLRGHRGLHPFCSILNLSWSSEPPKFPSCAPKIPLLHPQISPQGTGMWGKLFPAPFSLKQGDLGTFSSLSPTLLYPNPPVFILQSPWLKLPLVYFLPFNKYIYIYSLNSTFMCVYIYLSNALTKQKKLSFEEGTWS